MGGMMLNRWMLIAVLTILPVEARAQEAFKAAHNWGGLRERLIDKGFSFDVVYTGDLAANTKGGLKRESTYMSLLDLAMTADTAKAGLWENGRFFVHGLMTHDEGRLTGDFVGDRQTVSNIEAPTRTARLFEAWYEHQFLEERLSLLGGLHDFNSEFDVTEYADLFINDGVGFQSDISANARPSAFSLTAPGARLKWLPQDEWEFLLGLYDGNPGDADEVRHVGRWDFSKEDGVFIAEEAAHRHRIGDLPGALKLGAWQNTGDFNDVLAVDASGDPVVHDGNYGIYFVGEQFIYREKENQGLAAFVKMGGAPEDRNEISFYWNAGLNYLGPIPGRDQDQAGFAVARAYISDDFRQTQASDAAETVLEWTYRAHICDNFSVHPDVQYVINPGADHDLDNALVTTLRFEVVL
jgi:porin